MLVETQVVVVLPAAVVVPAVVVVVVVIVNSYSFRLTQEECRLLGQSLGLQDPVYCILHCYPASCVPDPASCVPMQTALAYRDKQDQEPP